MANIDWDSSDFTAKTEAMVLRVQQNNLKAVNDIANTILALSQNEVPIKDAILQNSGHVNQAKDISNPEAIVGYNTPYAAYQHEGMRRDGSHVVTHYTNPRSKKKFLEDPIRNNVKVFKTYFSKLLG